MNYLNILIKGNFNKWGGENNFVRKLYFYYQKNILIINIIEYVYIYSMSCLSVYKLLYP